MGGIDASELWSIYRSCDVYVSSSLLEGFGLTLLEAMFVGKPIVTTRSGGTTEILTDCENGITVPTHDPKSLADALCSIIENPKWAEKVGEHNRSYVKSRFSWELAARSTVKVYEHAMQQTEQ